MKRLLIVLALLLVTLVPPRAGAYTISDMERRMVWLVNEQRRLAGVPEMTEVTELFIAARQHADWMLETNTFSHAGKGDSTAGQRIASTGYRALQWGEILGHLQPDGPENTVGAFMRHAPHREVMLDPTLTEIGAGLAIANGQSYWAVEMGRRGAVSPLPVVPVEVPVAAVRDGTTSASVALGMASYLIPLNSEAALWKAAKERDARLMPASDEIYLPENIVSQVFRRDEDTLWLAWAYIGDWDHITWVPVSN